MFNKLKKMIDDKKTFFDANEKLRYQMFNTIYDIRLQCQSPLQRREINELIKMVTEANNYEQFIFCAREIGSWKEHNKGCPLVQGKHND